MRILCAVVVWVLCFLFYNNAMASHAQGADLQYEYLGNNQYRITLSFYRDCSGIPFDEDAVTVNVTNPGCGNFNQNFQLTNVSNLMCQDGGTSGTLGCDVSPLCPDQLEQNECNYTGPGAALFPGVRRIVVQGIITLPSACNNWLVRFSESARNTSQNIGGGDLSIQAVINNSIIPGSNPPQNYQNSSVYFSSLPVPFYCVNNPVTYNQGAVDPDGDSLVYTIINPLGNNYNPIQYNGGYSRSQPIKTNPANTFRFDSLTGQMIFIPAQQETDVLAVRIDEYRNGVLVGSTMRDIQVKIINCTISTPSQEPLQNIQNANQQDSITLQVCPGTQVSFDIKAIDPNGKNLTMKSSIQGNPSPLPGAVLTQINQGVAPNDTVIARITWTPAVSDTGCKQFVLTAENDDCPIKGSQTKVYKVCVFNKVQVVSASPTFCGTPVQLTATGGTNFQWSPTTGLSAPNSLTPKASPTTPTMYKFTSDCGTDSVFVNVAPPFSYDAGIGGQICQNGQIELNASVDNQFTPYRIKWTPSNGLIDPLYGLPNDSILNPVASPTQTTKYTVSFTASTGCVNVDTVTVVVAGVGPAVKATTDVSTTCPGEPVQLMLGGSPGVCGLAVGTCIGNDLTAQVGTATSTSGNTPVQLPSPLGGYTKSSRHQILYRADEILATTKLGGRIKSIAINISSPGVRLFNLTVKVACVSEDSITGYVAGASLVTVYNPKNYVPSNGWNTLVFDKPYDWDGVSNLVIDICHDSVAPNGQNMKYQITRTDGSQGIPNFRSMWFTGSDKFDQCGVTGNEVQVVAARYKERPNIRFVVCVADLAAADVVWTPNTGPNAPTPPNIDSTVARPLTPEVYKASVSYQGGCIGNSFVYVDVDTSTQLELGRDTFICSSNESVRLTAQVKTSLPNPTYTYAWAANPPAGFTNPGSVGSIVVSPTVNTKYYVTVTGGSCTVVDSVQVSVGSPVPVTATATDLSCFGSGDGSIVVTVPPSYQGLSYSWTPDTIAGANPINLKAGVYSVTVLDQTGCRGSDTVIVSQPSVLQLNISKLNATCYGLANGNFTATVIGGTPAYNYNWQPTLANTATPSGVAAGVYTLTVTDAKGCTVSGIDSITQPPLFEVSVTTTNANCPTSNDGSATANVTGGVSPYTFLWDNTSGPQTQTGMGFGPHSVIVTDKNQCTAAASFNVDTNYTLRLSIQTTDASCFDGSDGSVVVSAINGTPNFSYSYFDVTNQSLNPNALPPGNFSVRATDGLNCITNEPFTIGSPSQIIIAFDVTNPSCSGDSNGRLTVAVTGGVPGYNYLWGDGNANSTVNNLPEGVYSVTVYDANQCEATESVTLSTPNPLTVEFIDKKEISCAGDSDGAVTAFASGGTPPYMYAWQSTQPLPQPASETITNLAPGVYSIEVSDFNGCKVIDSTIFLAAEPLGFNYVIPDSVSCPGYADGSIRVMGVGGTPALGGMPYSYSLDNVTYQQANVFSGLVAAQYMVYIKDANNCMHDTIIEVGQPLPMGLQLLPQDSIIALGNQLNLVAVISGYSGSDITSYQWSPQSGLSCTGCPSPTATPYNDIEYNLTVKYLGACIAEQTVRVFVADGLEFFAPNLISPNGDGINDEWNVFGYDMKTVNVKIFNRWGEKVFDSAGNQYTKWDGTYRGVVCEPSIFTYHISAEYLNGKVVEKTGTITLVR